MSDSDTILLTMRTMAWGRAKGELQGVLSTYWPSYRNDGSKIDQGYDLASKEIKRFIKKMDDVLG